MSIIWSFFSKGIGQESSKGMCTTCTKQLSVPGGTTSALQNHLKKNTSWLLVSSQKAEKDLSTPDRWRLKRKTQELCGVPARLGLGTPKCIDFATCFGLSRSVFKHQLNEKHANLTKSKHRKVKVENYWLQLVPLAALLRPPPLSPTATQPWSSPCSDWRPLVATTLTIGAWWNSDLLFMIKSA